ncbi:hypothetical protein CW304_06940 [Bacillus sp. UFRGS-B20]|nr:hypothetical protein CW304_06940 [Bacillus sp. UFRGS-B20]
MKRCHNEWLLIFQTAKFSIAKVCIVPCGIPRKMGPTSSYHPNYVIFPRMPYCRTNDGKVVVEVRPYTINGRKRLCVNI